MKKIIVLATSVVVGLAVMTACNNKSKPAQDTAPKAEVKAADTHNSQNSLDYEGVYAGVLPCADCEGIQYEITLGKDTWHKKMTYLGKGENVFESDGTYTWDNSGRIITLNGDTKPNQYQVGENVLFSLDMSGQRITGQHADKYILRKK